jgi:hypothetical protein
MNGPSSLSLGLHQEDAANIPPDGMDLGGSCPYGPGFPSAMRALELAHWHRLRCDENGIAIRILAVPRGCPGFFHLSPLHGCLLGRAQEADSVDYTMARAFLKATCFPASLTPKTLLCTRASDS